jgi:hypothetical protein
MIDNKEGTVIGLGCLALCSLYYFYHQSSQERQAYKLKRRELQEARKDMARSA